MKTLIVDDEMTSRQLLKSLLCRYGSCHLAESAEDALSVFRDAIQIGSPFGLVCMDIRLPGIDGVECVQKIRDIEEELKVQGESATRILMTTSAGSPREIVRSFQALCDAYILKPIVAVDLDEQLRNLGLIDTES